MCPARSIVLAGFGWVFSITFRSSLERQVFEGGFGPVQHFVNTTIMPPSQQKLEFPFHILSFLGGILWIFSCLAVCLF